MDPFLTKTVNDSGITVFQKVNAGCAEGGNVLLSPVALNFALATACAAAEGDTRDQLRELLRHRLLGSDHNDRKIHALYKPFSSTLKGLPAKAGLHMATAMWFDRESVKSQGDNLDAFGRQMAEVFGNELYDKADQATVNDWATESTAAMINRIGSEDEEAAEDVAPIIMTALTAVKANWHSAFDPFHTWPGEFVNDFGEGMMCQMMHQKGVFECAYLQEFRAVRIPCGANAETAVTFILPNFGTIDEAVKAFSAERWQTICKTLITEELRLFLPKFKVESANTSAKAELLDSGVTDVFSPAKADLTRLGESGLFWLEDIVLKSTFCMDESGAKPVQGVEDGNFAFTSVGSAVEFRLDRPFLFVFHRGDAIVQMGKVATPVPLEG